MRVVILGGGPAGFSAAVSAKRTGVEVILLERMKMLGGIGFQAGMYVLHGAKVALTEHRALGGGDLFDIYESIAIMKGVFVQGLGDLSTYNIFKQDGMMQNVLKERGIEFMLQKNVLDIEVNGAKVEAAILQGGERIEGDVFVDATGSTRGLGDCSKWGFGCVGCSFQCFVFGAPKAVIEKKVKTVAFQNDYGHLIGKIGRLGTSVKIALGSLSEKVKREIIKKGWVQIPVPSGVKPNTERAKRTGQLDSGLYGDTGEEGGFSWNHLTLLNVGGVVKLTTVACPLYARSLRSFPGLENSIILDPADGERGHMIHATSIALRDNALRVDGFENLFCAGNKAGAAESLLDAMVTGELAGHNAVRKGLGHVCLELPKTLAIGAFINHLGQMMRSEEGRKKTYGSLNTELLKSLKVFRESEEEIIKEVENTGLKDVYKKKWC